MGTLDIDEIFKQSEREEAERFLKRFILLSLYNARKFGRDTVQQLFTQYMSVEEAQTVLESAWDFAIMETKNFDAASREAGIDLTDVCPEDFLELAQTEVEDNEDV